MEPKIQSSFIPKNPVSISERGRRGFRFGGFFLITLLVLLASGVLWGGLLFYQNLIENAIAEKSARLEGARPSLVPPLIQEIERFDTRIRATEKLLKQHVVPSQLFALLESKTLQTVQFDHLEYTLSPNKDATLSAGGRANNFASVALQASEFEFESAFINPIFSSLNLDELGNVVFSFTTSIDSNILLYDNLFEDVVPAEKEEETEALFIPEEISSDNATTTATTTASEVSEQGDESGENGNSNAFDEESEVDDSIEGSETIATSTEQS